MNTCQSLRTRTLVQASGWRLTRTSSSETYRPPPRVPLPCALPAQRGTGQLLPAVPGTTHPIIPMPTANCALPGAAPSPALLAARAPGRRFRIPRACPSARPGPVPGRPARPAALPSVTWLSSWPRCHSCGGALDLRHAFPLRRAWAALALQWADGAGKLGNR
jgi:hypothetical protein